MNTKQLKLIKDRLNCVWPNVMETPEAVNVWYDTMKTYDFQLIETAAIEYMKQKPFPPTPADLIMLIPTKPANPATTFFRPKYEIRNGKEVRVISCRRCNDTGLITFRDKDLRIYGKVCECAAGMANYGSWARAKTQ